VLNALLKRLNFGAQISETQENTEVNAGAYQLVEPIANYDADIQVTRIKNATLCSVSA